MGDDRDVSEILGDPMVQRALRAYASRLPRDPCPRCLRAPIATNSRHGFCQPCETDYIERIRASRRRSYHRRKNLSNRRVPGAREHDGTRRHDDEGVTVGDNGWRLLTIDETAEILAVTPRQVRKWISDGTLRSIKLGGSPDQPRSGVRRVPADAIVDLVEAAERAAHIDDETQEEVTDDG